MEWAETRWRAKGDEDLNRRDTVAHQVAALEIGNEIQSESKLSDPTRFLLIRFRPNTVLVVIIDPEVIANLSTKGGNDIMLSRLPKRYQCRGRINGL